MNTRHSVQFLSALLCLILMSCGGESSTDMVEEEISNTPPSLSSQKEFYHAWLGDCMNDVPFTADNPTKAKKHFEGIANNRLDTVIKKKAIKDAFGSEKLVWGPVLSVDDQGSGSYVSKNLMYCLQSVSSSGTTYSIGIAGTDMVSPFDWMSEDLNVDSLVTWIGGGKISEGSFIGFSRLNSLVEDSSGKTLHDFLMTELKTHPKANINVAGHSLGGALTQVYASFLKSTLTNTTAHPKVYAWVYAGPTAGNKTFAESLTNLLDGYYSYSNTLDVIPHAWEKKKLEKLCALYDGVVIAKYKPLFSKEYYYKIKSTPALQGVIYYLRSQSKNGDFTDPGLPANQHTFSMGTNKYMLSRFDFDLFESTIGGFYDAGHNKLYTNLNAISKSCNSNSSISESDFKQFFYYMVELGSQHTSAYFDYFFQGKSSDFTGAITTAVPGGITHWNDLLNAGEGKDILEKFLGEVAGFYSSNTNCSCSAPI